LPGRDKIIEEGYSAFLFRAHLEARRTNAPFTIRELGTPKRSGAKLKDQEFLKDLKTREIFNGSKRLSAAGQAGYLSPIGCEHPDSGTINFKYLRQGDRIYRNPGDYHRAKGASDSHHGERKELRFRETRARAGRAGSTDLEWDGPFLFARF
jgi:hypothetical protein